MANDVWRPGMHRRYASNDDVNHPAHYKTGKIEVIEFIEDQKFGYLEGNVIKYVSRARHKGCELKDLKKARWYLSRAIQRLESAGYHEAVVSLLATHIPTVDDRPLCGNRDPRAVLCKDMARVDCRECILEWGKHVEDGRVRPVDLDPKSR